MKRGNALRDVFYEGPSLLPYSVRETYEYSTAGATSKKTLRLKQKNGIAPPGFALLDIGIQ